MGLIKYLKLPANKQGIVIDALVIIINLFLFPILSGRIEGMFEGSFENNPASFIAVGVLMIVLLVGRLGGLFLKRFPLQARMRNSSTVFPAYFLVFSVPILILSAVGAAVAIEQFAAGIGWIPVAPNGQPVESRALNMVTVFSVIFLAGVEIFLLFRLGKPLSIAQSKNASNGNLLYGWPAEFIADLGLFAYMTVWQIAYYGVADMLLEPPVTPQGWDFYVFRFVFLALCFGLFYLSPRAVFLTEDRKYLSTWIFITLAFISSLLPHWLQKITGIFF